MGNNKILNTKGAVLDKHGLERYLEKLASDQILKEKSDKNTYPIPRMKENFDVITEVYNVLNEHINLKIPIHPAGEWLLDNYYVIEETVKNIEKSLTLKEYKTFLGIANEANYGFARIYVLANEIVTYTDSKIDGKILKDLLRSYQEKKKLSMNEIWNIGTFLQISLIENIREICERIYSAQVQKYKVENIIERLVENKEKDELKFNKLNEYKEKVKEYGEMKYPFIEYMSFKLRQFGKKAYPFLNILEEQVSKMGVDISDVIKKEHFDIAVKKVSIGNAITSIKAIQRINFTDIFESINQVDDILKKDPANTYEKMDYKTKIYYRNVIEEISKKTKISEIYIAKKCLELAQQNDGEFNHAESDELKKEKGTIIYNNIGTEDIKNVKTSMQEEGKQSENEHTLPYKENVEGEKNKKAHVGYYLIDEGKHELLEKILGKKIKTKTNTQKIRTFIIIKVLISLLISALLGTVIFFQTNSYTLGILTIILIYIPVEEIFKQIAQYVLSKVIKPKQIPKLDFQSGVTKEYATFVVIPTIISKPEKLKEMFKKLEVYYIANKSENMYFALLGDVTASTKKDEDFDEDISRIGLQLVKKLNEKYPDKTFPKFHFIYRRREWNDKEECYLGWERKRGLLNQFNEYILKNEPNPFRINTIDLSKLPNIKYVITLDADTELVLNTGLELVGAMAHILNRPEIKDGIVVKGHAIMQPRIGVNLDSAIVSKFTKMYAGLPGTDAYTNAISDIYQDNFEEGIFTGKGIYDVKVFSKVLKNEIPENTVLSHDLLEGSYLRCGLASDIMLMDGYPTSYMSYKTRQSRWTRGDVQILRWLKKNIKDRKGKEKKNPLNLLSKYKIADNLKKHLVTPSVIICGIFAIILWLNKVIKIWPIVIVLLLAILAPYIIEIANRIIYKKDGETFQKTFYKSVSGIKLSIIKGILELGLLPDKAYTMFTSIIKSIYRMCKSKKHLLEWTTAEEAEAQNKTGLISYYTNMLPNLILGIIVLILGYKNIALSLLGILWIVAPSVMNYISKKQEKIKPIEELTKEEQEYVLEIGRRTWKFFKENITKKSNFLPPDNYQEDRKEQVVYRTSPTNIGLGLLSVTASFDLGFENLENTIQLLYKMIETVEKLQKWNGHLYNWYNIQTLEPLNPKYVSTVDSGNFVGYLYTLKQFLANILDRNPQVSEQNVENGRYNLSKDEENVNNSKTKVQISGKDTNNKISIAENNIQINEELKSKIEIMINIIDNIIQKTDFSHLYSKENRIFSIGYNVEEGALTPSYYDLLASEARQASLVAIAKKDIPEKHWYNLSRTLTILNRYKGLISWSGTAFEYLMPNINIPKYPGSIIDESSLFAIMSQMEYAKKLNIPFGISEAAFNLRDLNNNYQYKAFGIPWLGLKRGLADELVVSAYGALLAINDFPKETVENLKFMEAEGMLDKYGFYESIDYTLSRLRKNEKKAVVKTYMAHHQGLILLSIDNLFNSNILQKRFMQNPEMQAVNILLEERMPENVIITKEQKEKVEKIKNVDYETYRVREYTKAYDKLNNINVISNESYTVVIDQKGDGYSKYKDIAINRFKKTDELQEGIHFYLKNINTKRIWTSGQMKYLSNADKYTVQFSPDMSKFIRQDGSIETTTKITVMPNSPVEIRRVELKNLGNFEETIEITSVLEPILSSLEQDYSHKAFNNLFLTFEYDEETNSIIARRKARDTKQNDIYMAVNLYTENETVGDLEYELEKEKVYGRQNVELPEAVEKSIPLSRKTQMTTDPIIAMRKTVNILPSETVALNLIIGVANSKAEALELIKENMNNEKILRNLKLARAKVEAETMYLGIKAVSIESYQKMLRYLIYQNPLKLLMYKGKIPDEAPISELWKFGISGDLPILLIKIKDVSDMAVIRDVLKAYEYFRVKNIKIDLVILNEEKKTYDNYLQEEIQNAILDRGLAYMQNIQEGIFVLSNLDKEAKRMLEYRANLLVNAHLGNIARQIKDYEDEYKEKLKEIGFEANKNLSLQEEKLREPLKGEKLKYFNEYGGFSNDGTEYILRINKEEKLPTVWSNIMANEKFGTVVTEGMGGYTWYKNSRLNRITAWNNDQITDVPSEAIYLEDLESQKVWSLGVNPSPDDNDYYVTYGFGYSKFYHTNNEIVQKLKIYVPKEESVKVNILHLANKRAKRRKLKLVYYIKPVLDEDETKSNGYIDLKYNESLNLITLQNDSKPLEQRTIAYVSASEKIASYTGSKDSFIGSGTVKNPEGVRKLELDRENSLGKDESIAIEIRISLEAFEEKNIIIILGADENSLNIKDTAYKYTNINNAINEYENTKRYWKDLLGKIKVETPVESMNIMLNGWLLYQTLCSRMLARSGYYQSGGAYGFRDQLQDCIGLKYISSEILKKQIIKHSKHQFIEGDVEHWWHEETSRGIRTRFSDDLLWLPYMVAEYIESIGDSSILKEETEYVQGPVLEEGVDERYDLYLPSNQKESIYMHCIRAIERSLKFGENGLPLIGSGDWNDGFSTVGNKGKGESVWLGFFQYKVLEMFSKICEEYGEKLENEKEGYANDIATEATPNKNNSNEPNDLTNKDNIGMEQSGTIEKIKNLEENRASIEDSLTQNKENELQLKKQEYKLQGVIEQKENKAKERANRYRKIMENLKRALNTKAWDGRWYRRAFMDNGNMLGSIQNEECRIDSIAQSWATISGAGDNDKKYISMNSLENHLVDKEAGIIKLLDPPFEKSKLEPGYIKAYIPGTRENGGQYTHGAIWAICAEAMLGFGDKATEYFRMINPIEHSKSKEQANRYKVEPYVVAADIYGGNLAGRGGWTWYTGSSSWMYESGIKYILGVKIQGNTLKIEPNIPSDWKEYKIRYKFGNSIYNIKVENNKLEKQEVFVDGNQLENNTVLLNPNGGVYSVEVKT